MNKRLILFLMLSTAVLAIASFAIMLALSRRPAGPETTVDQSAGQPAPAQGQLAIDGTLVTVNLVPEREVRLVAEMGTFLQATEPETTTDPNATGQEEQAISPPTATPMTVEVVPTNTPAPVVGSAEPIVYINYTVQAGDTMYSIAAAQNSGVALMATSGISGDDIVPGNTISVPIANPAYCPGSRAYVVKEGDTAYSIGRRFNTTHDAIRGLNGLDAAYTIKIGQVLCVP
jgi:LysM repeat protein